MKNSISADDPTLLSVELALLKDHVLDAQVDERVIANSGIWGGQTCQASSGLDASTDVAYGPRSHGTHQDALLS